MTGRVTPALIASATPLVNTPRAVEVPIRMVGFTSSTTVCRPMMPELARDCCRAAISGRRGAGSSACQRAEQPGHDDHAGALHVVVEDPVLVPVGDQDPARVLRAEVLAVQQGTREPRRRRRQVLPDDRVLIGAADARVPVAQVQRVVQQRLVVRPDIQRNGDYPAGVDSRRGGVRGQLADGDHAASHAPVADGQDLLGVTADDEATSSGPRRSTR
jgi:hypothetical protein